MTDIKITEPLPNDGAPYRCYRKTNTPPDYICGKPATHGLTREAFEQLRDMFRMRAVCPQHAVEADIELNGND